MDHSMNYSQKDCTSNNPSSKKLDYWVDVDEESAKYRDIPVFQALDDFKSANLFCENVSGVKERIKSSHVLKGDVYHVKNTSVLDTEGKTGTNKKRSKLDPAISVNALQMKHYSEHSFFDRLGQGSVSEPNLCNAKDRGDSINLQDFDNPFSYKCFRDGKTKAPKDRGVKGCIYVKSGGKVYKSTIETRNFQAVDDLHFKSPSPEEEKHKISLPLRKSVPVWNKLDSGLKIYGKNGKHCSKEELDDFEIAIFLCGIKNVSEKSHKKQRKLDDNRKKEDENETKQERKGKRKKKSARKNETTIVLDKKFEIGDSKSYHVPTKMLTIDPYCAKKNYLNEQIVKSRIQLKFSSGSESEYILATPDKASNSMKRLRNAPESNLRAITSNENRSPDLVGNYRSKKNEIASYRSRGTPHSSYFQFSDGCKTPKKKICEGELWGTFEIIFRSYASTTRHSGEVIPRKISTEWMTNAGVVDEIMTEKEADDAFRQAAGAKITMNAQEYKEFLILLTLRMKLPYYEIYRRMCGI